MCNYLKSQGRKWALDTLSDMVGMTASPRGRGQVVATIALGKVAKPEGYAIGVQTVIDDIRRIEARSV